MASPRDYIPFDSGTFFFILYYNHSFGNDLYANWNKKSHKKLHGQSQHHPPRLLYAARSVYGRSLIYPAHRWSHVVQKSVLRPWWFDLGVHHLVHQNKESKLIFACTPFLMIPTGQYDRESGVNMGSNRWATKHELCIAKGFGDKLWIKFTVNAQFYSTITMPLIRMATKLPRLSNHPSGEKPISAITWPRNSLFVKLLLRWRWRNYPGRQMAKRLLVRSFNWSI